MKTLSEIGKMLANAEKRPMNDMESRIFMNLNVNPGLTPDLKSHEIHEIIEKNITKDIEENAVAFLSILCDAPGDAKLYAALADYQWELNQGEIVTLDSLYWGVFLGGIPTEESLKKAWEEYVLFALKCDGFNLEKVKF